MNRELTSVQYYFLCFLLCIFACGSIFFFWPGFMSPDTHNQLGQAIAGQYSDHHPPLLSLYWRLWLWWRQGPEPILLTYQALLFISACVFLLTFKAKKIGIIIPFIPLFPHVLFYSGAIWKDVGFGLSYLCAASLLVNSSIRKQPLSFIKILSVWSLLVFGFGIKYQALFVLPVMAFWAALSLSPKSSLWIKMLMGFLVWGSVIGGNYVINKTFITRVHEYHSWQKVKLFDLAGISASLDQDLFPEFVKKNPLYSFEKVKEAYSPFRVDELLIGWSPQGSLEQGQTPSERDILWNTWFNALKKHPLIYLKHRFAVWKTMVYNSPMKSLDDLKSVHLIPTRIQETLKQFNKIIEMGKSLTRFIYWVPLIFIYLIIGILYSRKNPSYAIPLIFMNLTGLSLMGALFIFSMASDLRYIYLTMVFLHFSHPLAWGTIFYGRKRD